MPNPYNCPKDTGHPMKERDKDVGKGSTVSGKADKTSNKRNDYGAY